MENYPDYPIDGSSICQSPEDCVKLYETWAATYDDDVKREEYRGPELLVEICLEYLKDKNCKILDFLCGTGVDARLLAQHGYQCIDGIDGSQKMLDHSQQLGLYQNLYLEILHPGVPSKQLRREYYDVLIGVGIFAPGHLQGDFLNHLYEPVKRGGLIIFGIREPWVEELNLTEDLNRLENEGVWRLIERVKKADYRQNVPGVFYIFQRL